jgi:hypothetical protein
MDPRHKAEDDMRCADRHKDRRRNIVPSVILRRIAGLRRGSAEDDAERVRLRKALDKARLMRDEARIFRHPRTRMEPKT